MALDKKRNFSIIYTTIVAIVAVIALGVSAKAYYLSSFSYESYHPMYYGWSGVQAKTDSSEAAVYYINGPDGYDLNVQLWGSDGTSANAYNFTKGVSTITVPKGEVIRIPNTAYQYYNGGQCYVRLKMWVYSAGKVSGSWSSTTN